MKANVWDVLLVTEKADNRVLCSDGQILFCDIMRDSEADSVTSSC